MSSVNKAIIVGFVGKDPDIRVSQSGTFVASFSIATSEFWKDKSTGERKERTTWHRVVIFNEGRRQGLVSGCDSRCCNLQSGGAI